MALDHLLQLLLGLLLFVLGRGGVDHSGLQHPAGGVHHCDFAAGAVGGVQAQGNLSLDRRLHQQVAQVEGKDVDGLVGGGLGQLAVDLPLQGGEDEPGEGVGCRGFQFLPTGGRLPF